MTALDREATTTPWHDEARDRLRAQLEGFAPRAAEDAAGRPASVVLAVVPDDDGLASVVLTRRPRGLRRHGGQFALPGGRREVGESDLDAGLRELHEEVGMVCTSDDVLGQLDAYPTQSGFLITPFVVWTDAQPRVADAVEVATTYRVPLDECAAEDALRPGWPLRAPALHLPTVGHRVFAPTAAIIHQLAQLAVHGRRLRVDSIPQPQFAWR